MPPMLDPDLDLPEFLRQELVDGRPWSVFSDGTRLPVISGAADDGGAGDGAGDGGDGGDGADGADDDDDDDLGEKGEKALAAERAARRAARKEARAEKKRADELEARLAKLEADKKSDGDKVKEDAAAAAKDITDRAKEEAEQTLLGAKVEAAVLAAAAGKLANPALAVRLLDLDDLDEFVDEGKVDKKAVAKAVSELVKENPGLAATAGNGAGNGKGDADGGARTRTKGDDDVTPGMGRLRRAYADNSST